jgi:lactate dehydrogenase-like 2-hydroxyacid dehydrogenase
MKPLVLVTIPFPIEGMAALRRHFEIIHAPSASDLDAVLKARGDEVRGVLTNSASGLGAATMSHLPALEIVLTQGAGFDGVDLDAARRRGVVVANGSGVNAESVAQHAFALMLASMRDIVIADRTVRTRGWAVAKGLRPLPSGKKLGILGLGAVGEHVARYGEAFHMKIAYHNRSPRPDVGYHYAVSPHDLAGMSDVLIVTCPGGAATRHIVDGGVLEALGPAGFLVNVSRGSNVDEAALLSALRNGRVAGAAIDVVEGEPSVSDELLSAPRLIITPHIAGSSPEALAAKIAHAVDNLQRHFSGRQVLSRVA